MPCTQAQLKKAAKWRDNNRDKYREIIRTSRHKNYDADKENKRKFKYYHFKKECQRLMNILL